MLFITSNESGCCHIVKVNVYCTLELHCDTRGYRIDPWKVDKLLLWFVTFDAQHNDPHVHEIKPHPFHVILVPTEIRG